VTRNKSGNIRERTCYLCRLHQQNETDHSALPIFRNQCVELRQHHSWRRSLRKVRYTVLKIQYRITLSNLHSSPGNQNKSSSAIVSWNRIITSGRYVPFPSDTQQRRRMVREKKKKTKGASSSNHFGFVENFYVVSPEVSSTLHLHVLRSRDCGGWKDGV